MKQTFIKSTITLIIGGLLTKVLGMVIRILTTRSVGIEGMGLYMLVMPSFNLFITIATLSLPIAISKLIAEDTKNNKKLLFTTTIVAMLFNILIILIIFITAPFIANNLLKNNDLYYPIIACGLTLPFITLSSIARGYFFGKEKMLPHVTSNILEQIVRIIFIVLFTPFFLKKGVIYAVTALIIFNIVSEITSILVLFFFLPKNSSIKKSDLKVDKDNIKDIFKISIPTTLGRLVGAIGNFFEPIILTFVFLSLGYSNTYITNEYGVMSGYVLPMVSMPSFLTGAISSALLPVISKQYARKKKNEVKRKIKQACFFSMLVGIPATVLFMLFPEFFLELIFKDASGAFYLKIASPIFLISYVASPLMSALQAINKASNVMIISVVSIIIKSISLFLLTYLDIGMLSLLLSSGLSYIYLTTSLILCLRKNLN